MEVSTQMGKKGPLPPKRRSKSRSGCQRCKQRRIKCDERVPFCGPCLKRGFNCPGYQQPMKWRYLDVSGQKSTQKPDVEADRRHSSEDDTERFTWSENVIAIQDSGESESASSGNPATSETSINTNSFLNDLATEDIENMGADVMDTWLDHSIFESEYLCPLFKPIDDKTIVLSTHYFSNVCTTNSCFDSNLNPFRSVIADLMNSSQLIFHLVMMTSASHLSHQQSEMFSVERQHRRDSIPYPIENKNVTHRWRFEAVLGSVLLGMTSAWRDSSALGISHIHTARALFQETIASSEATIDPRSISFLVGIMAYWEAMVSIASTQSPRSLDYLIPFCEQENHDTLVYPNPWTGASTTIFIYAAEVSSLCRQNRVTKYLSSSIGSAELRESIFHEQFTEASELEAKVLQYSPPISNRIKNPDDRLTPVSHLQCLAQIYRFSVLMQLYITFPSLLQKSTTKMSTPNTGPSNGRRTTP